MGSRITRTLSISDRNRRIHPSSQQEIKSFIRAMIGSLFGFLVFSTGLLTSRSAYEPTHSCLQCLVFATTSALILNSTNQQLCLIMGWTLITIHSLFLKTSMQIMFNFGSFLTLHSIFTNLYNYYSQTNQTPLLRYFLPSGLIVLGTAILEIGHCCGHFIKMVNHQQQINMGLRVVICIIGVMVVALAVMGHVHCRSRRFVPVGILEQVGILWGIGRWGLGVVGGLVVGWRGLLVKTQLLHKCEDGLFLVLTLVFTILILLSFAYTLTPQLHKTPKLLPFLTILLVPVSIVTQSLSLPFYISYPVCLVVSQLIITQITNCIENEMRVNYLLALITAVICEINGYEHMHLQNSGNWWDWVVVAVGIGGGLTLEWLRKYRTSRPTVYMGVAGTSASQFQLPN